MKEEKEGNCFKAPLQLVWSNREVQGVNACIMHCQHCVAAGLGCLQYIRVWGYCWIFSRILLTQRDVYFHQRNFSHRLRQEGNKNTYIVLTLFRGINGVVSVTSWKCFWVCTYVAVRSGREDGIGMGINRSWVLSRGPDEDNPSSAFSLNENNAKPELRGNSKTLLLFFCLCCCSECVREHEVIVYRHFTVMVSSPYFMKRLIWS